MTDTSRDTDAHAGSNVSEPRPGAPSSIVFECRDVSVAYSGVTAIENVDMDVPAGEITALIGPSGCGKSTLLRCYNRMNDLVVGAEISGAIKYHDTDLYDSAVDPVEVRRRIGMVFQKPNPFPKSIFDNIAYGPRIQGTKKDKLGEIVEWSLQKAALWEEVKDRLGDSAFGLSGGQQQRLCIARAIATSPDVILMDEPCSALDPIATALIEELMEELKGEYTILIVTHNMQQAARVSDMTAFITTDVHEGGRIGHLVEFDHTEKIFTSPSDPRTEGYITGRFG